MVKRPVLHAANIKPAINSRPLRRRGGAVARGLAVAGLDTGWLEVLAVFDWAKRKAFRTSSTLLVLLGMPKPRKIPLESDPQSGPGTAVAKWQQVLLLEVNIGCVDATSSNGMLPEGNFGASRKGIPCRMDLAG